MSLVLDVAAAFTAADVDYVVAGGVAVLLHGHARMTVDLDVVIELGAANIEAALATLGELGLRPRLPVDPSEFADPDTRTRWVRERNLIAFTMHDPTDARREVDIFADPPIPFEDLAARAETVTVGDVEVRVVSVDDLIAMKRIADRPQDRADVAALLTLRSRRTLEGP